MKIKIFTLFLIGIIANTNAQNCDEILKSVKSKGYGSTYYSPTSSAISQVTFYDISIDYKSYYFAVVKFTSDYFKEYIYQVGSNSKFNYSMKYLDSAGEAFWEYIQPYNENLGCAPDFKQ